MILLYILLALAAVLPLVTHRSMPMWIAQADLFSRKHVIAHSHSVRDYETRLGAAVTFAFGMASLALLINAYYEPNDQTASALERPSKGQFDDWVRKVIHTAGSASADPTVLAKAASFGPVSITASVLSSTPESKCDEIVATIKEPHPLGCTNSTKIVVTPPGADTKVCSITWECTAPLNIPGVASVKLQLPTAFQAINWNVSSRSWVYFGLKESRLNSFLIGTLAASKGQVLCGSESKPSEIVLRSTRGFSQVNYPQAVNYTTAGMLVGWETTTRSECDRWGNEISGTAKGRGKANKAVSASSAKTYHVVQFRFVVSAVVHSELTTEKFTFRARVGVLAGLVTTLLSFVSFIKMRGQQLIDKAFYLQAERSGGKKKVPDDIKRRCYKLKDGEVHELMEDRTRSMKNLVLENIEVGDIFQEENDLELHTVENPMKAMAPTAGKVGRQPMLQQVRSMQKEIDKLTETDQRRKKEIDKLTKEVAALKKSMAAILEKCTGRANKVLEEPTSAPLSAKSVQIHTDDATGQRYSWNPITNETKWVD
jgi:hypothetical protein